MQHIKRIKEIANKPKREPDFIFKNINVWFSEMVYVIGFSNIAYKMRYNKVKNNIMFYDPYNKSVEWAGRVLMSAYNDFLIDNLLTGTDKLEER